MEDQCLQQSQLNCLCVYRWSFCFHRLVETVPAQYWGRSVSFAMVWWTSAMCKSSAMAVVKWLQEKENEVQVCYVHPNKGGSAGKVGREALIPSIYSRCGGLSPQLFCHLTGVLPLFKGSFDCQDLINSGIILASGVNYQGKRVQDRVSVPTVTSMS